MDSQSESGEFYYTSQSYLQIDVDYVGPIWKTEPGENMTKQPRIVCVDDFCKIPDEPIRPMASAFRPITRVYILQ